MHVVDGVLRIPLQNGMEAVVDLADQHIVEGRTWYAMEGHSTWYVYNDHTALHRVLVNASPEQLVDHRDGNGLNNRRHNIRVCTKAQNSMNSAKQRGRSSPYKGVTFNKNKGRWESQIMLDKKKRLLGYYQIEAHAALAYDRAARQLFGEFARTNFSPAETAIIAAEFQKCQELCVQ